MRSLPTMVRCGRAERATTVALVGALYPRTVAARNTQKSVREEVARRRARLRPGEDRSEPRWCTARLRQQVGNERRRSRHGSGHPKRGRRAAEHLLDERKVQVGESHAAPGGIRVRPAVDELALLEDAAATSDENDRQVQAVVVAAVHARPKVDDRTIEHCPGPLAD